MDFFDQFPFNDVFQHILQISDNGMHMCPTIVVTFKLTPYVYHKTLANLVVQNHSTQFLSNNILSYIRS